MSVFDSTVFPEILAMTLRPRLTPGPSSGAFLFAVSSALVMTGSMLGSVLGALAASLARCLFVLKLPDYLLDPVTRRHPLPV